MFLRNNTYIVVQCQINRTLLLFGHSLFVDVSKLMELPGIPKLLKILFDWNPEINHQVLGNDFKLLNI